MLNVLCIFAITSEFRFYLKTQKDVWDLHLSGDWLTVQINHTEFLPSPERFLRVGLQLFLISQKVFKIAINFGFGLPWSPQWIDS